jgi:hypothetical protein
MSKGPSNSRWTPDSQCAFRRIITLSPDIIAGMRIACPSPQRSYICERHPGVILAGIQDDMRLRILSPGSWMPAKRIAGMTITLFWTAVTPTRSWRESGMIRLRILSPGSWMPAKRIAGMTIILFWTAVTPARSWPGHSFVFPSRQLPATGGDIHAARKPDGASQAFLFQNGSERRDAGRLGWGALVFPRRIKGD